MPCLQARLDILKIHSRKMNLTRGINLRKIAEMMPGASGAEVKVSYILWLLYIMYFYFKAVILQEIICIKVADWPDTVSVTIQGVCTEAGMYALRERRVHVTQEDFELAVAKVSSPTL